MEAVRKETRLFQWAMPEVIPGPLFLLDHHPHTEHPDVAITTTREPRDAARTQTQTVRGARHGVFVDIPQPSSSAMQAFHAAQHSQTGTQISLPASIFDGLGAPTAAAESHSEYVPSSHADSSVAVEAMRPLPAMDVRAFEPFLDDTTGMDLDRADKVQQRVDSSPVESFSPAEVVKAQDVPRVGAWVLPELTEENANPRLPDYTSQEVLSQIPYPILDREEQEAQQAQHMVSQPSPERQRSSPPPIQSTPANPAVQSEPEMVLTQPIPDAPESTPALPPPTAVASQVDTSSGSSTSSLGWSALPAAR